MENHDCDKSGKSAEYFTRVGRWRQTTGNHAIHQRLQSTKLAMDKAVIGHGDSDSDKTRDKVCQDDKSAEGKKEVPPKTKIKKKHTKATHVKKTQNVKPRSSNQLKRMFDPKSLPRRPRSAISTSSSYYTSSEDS